MAKQYRIKQFSKLTSITVRALHYYDEISLLKPSHRLDSGHRLYSENDMLRLQQITTLKFMGFSLEQISQLLQHPDFNITESLRKQAEMLAEEAMKIQNAVKLLKQVANQLDTSNPVNWKTIAKIIEVLQMKEQSLEAFVTTYFTKDELNDFAKNAVQYTPQQTKEISSRWADIFSEIKKNMNFSPESKVGQQLAAKWLALVDEIYGKHPNIRDKIWEACKAGAVPTEIMPYYDQSVIDYIDKATTYYKQKIK
jgi:DNA-binding transcriptional MerR regulator